MKRRRIRIKPAEFRALTVLQPFASAICSDEPTAKRNENRSWRHDWGGGEWVAIHSGARPYPVKGPDGWIALIDDLTRRTGWDAWTTGGTRPLGYPKYPRGAILGLARFVDCVPVQQRLSDPWAVGPWCHIISEVRVLPSPILGVKGALGFWRVLPEHDAKLRELL